MMLVRSKSRLLSVLLSGLFFFFFAYTAHHMLSTYLFGEQLQPHEILQKVIIVTAGYMLALALFARDKPQRD